MRKAKVKENTGTQVGFWEKCGWRCLDLLHFKDRVIITTSATGGMHTIEGDITGLPSQEVPKSYHSITRTALRKTD